MRSSAATVALPPLLLSLLLRCRDAAAAEGCKEISMTPLPAENDEYVKRFEEAYSTYHLYTASQQSLATPAKEEVLEAIETRNSFRNIYRWEPPSHRFCGIKYPPGPGGVDCMPADTTAQDSAWMQQCYAVRPLANESCIIEGLDSGLTKYGLSLAGPLAVGIALGVAFPILCAFWYILRCCRQCGGRKHSKGMFCVKTEEAPGYSKLHVLIFKALFGLFFLLAVIAGSIGFAGDGLLGSGLRDSVDVLLHGLSQQVSQVQTVTARINELTAGSSSLDSGDLSMINEISCFVGKAQAAIEDNGTQLFSIRSIAVICVSLVPMTVMVAGLVAAVCNLRHLSCCVATQIAWLMLVVWLSFGLHGMLAVVFGDVCTEMDLVLQTPKGGDVNLGFLPMVGGMCGRDGQLGAVVQKLERESTAQLQTAVEEIRDKCNDNPAIGDNPLDCTLISGTGKILDGAYPNYVVGDFTLYNFPRAFELIRIADPGVQPTCNRDFPTAAAGTCPDVDPSNSCTIPANPTAPTYRLLPDCAKPGDAVNGCQFPDSYELACALISDPAIGTANGLVDLLETEIQPLVRCEWGKDLFGAMYMPMCVDATSGFALVTASNGFGGIIMLIMLPFMVAATKRLDKRNQIGKVEVFQGDTSTGP